MEGVEEEPYDENLMELDRPLTADETRRLAESWKKRYSTDPERNEQEHSTESTQETPQEGKKPNVFMILCHVIT